jgi:hypothetical protein
MRSGDRLVKEGRREGRRGRRRRRRRGGVREGGEGREGGKDMYTTPLSVLPSPPARCLYLYLALVVCVFVEGEI